MSWHAWARETMSLFGVLDQVCPTTELVMQDLSWKIFSCSGTATSESGVELCVKFEMNISEKDIYTIFEQVDYLIQKAISFLFLVFLGHLRSSIVGEEGKFYVGKSEFRSTYKYGLNSFHVFLIGIGHLDWD